MQKPILLFLLVAMLLLLGLAGDRAAVAAAHKCSYPRAFAKFPSVTNLRVRRTTCRTGRRVARKVQDNGSALQPLIYVAGERWKAKYITRTEGDAVWYHAVLRSHKRVVTMDLGS